jgi:hypothetical protein
MGAVTCSGGEPLVSDGWLARLRFGVLAGVSASSLAWFDDARDGDGTAELYHRSLTAMVEARVSRRWAVAMSLGALGPGRLDIEWPSDSAAPTFESYSLTPGFLGSLSGSYVALVETPDKPFVLVGLTLGVGTHGAEPRDGSEALGFAAVDARASVTVGKTFAEVLRPYVSARAFGGPIFLGPTARGTDRYHLQGALGLSVALPRGFDVFAEVAPGPERSGTIGVAFAPGR